MAITFDLSIESTSNQKDFDALIKYFNGHEIKLSDGRKVLWACEAHSSEGFPFLTVYTRDLGFGSLKENVARSEAAIDLFKLLLSAPPFVFAEIGAQIGDGGGDHQSLVKYIRQDPILNIYDGMVLSDEFWVELGKPDRLRQFRPGYVWKPYRGEKEIPIVHFHGYQQIYEKLRELPGIEYGPTRSEFPAAKDLDGK